MITDLETRATERLSPHPDDLLALLATSPAARQEAARLVAQHLAPLRIGICVAALAVGIILSIAAYVAGVDLVYGVAAGAHLVALAGWCVWFQEWR